MWRNWIPFWRPGVSSYGGDIDLLFAGLMTISLAVLLLLFILLLTFAIRYRADQHRRPRTSHQEELVLGDQSGRSATLFGFLRPLCLGCVALPRVYGEADHALPIYVVAKQWMWKVQHPGGQREINELHVPVGEPVRLTMTSQDVIHSFFVPAFRVKQDVLPGRYQKLWFTATSRRLSSFSAPNTAARIIRGWSGRSS